MRPPARNRLGIYGFRITEPQHDGTPHWHLLLFCQPEHADLIEAIILKQALEDSPEEPGAREHRCDFKRIDKAKGSATGYIAKYIAKNIDGEHIDKDLEGCTGAESAQRVEAWAARWGIRQFQQIGGPPVGVWRELRRIKHIDAHAPECLHAAHKAANKREATDDQEAQGAAWDMYCDAQGGVFCGRDGLIKLMKEQPEALGQYGEQQAPRPVGVQVVQAEQATPPYRNGMGTGYRGDLGAESAPQPRMGKGYSEGSTQKVWEARSARYKWEVVSARQRGIARGFESERAQPSTPWTSVNNCTEYVEPSTHHRSLPAPFQSGPPCRESI